MLFNRIKKLRDRIFNLETGVTGAGSYAATVANHADTLLKRENS